LRPRDVEGWPDGTFSAGYGFIHTFFQRVLYEQVGEARRVRLHRLIGKRKEVGYGERAAEIAAELALHFERGLEYPQAVRYHRLAGENALRRRSHREAADHITRGIELLGELPDSPERTQEELYLQSALSRALAPTHGPVSPDVERANARAWELCQRVGETPQVFAVMLSLSVSYLTQGRLREAQKLAEQLLHVAESVNEPSLLLAARVALGNCLFWRGELGPAREQLEQCVGVSATDRDETISLLYAFDVRVRTLSTLSFLLCLQGYPDQSLARATEAIGLAEQESSPFDVASARTFAALVHLCRREHEAARVQATAAVEISRDHGFPLFLAAGTMFEGWALAESGQGKAGAARMREGLAGWEKCAALLLQSYLLALLADVCLKNGNADEGLRAVEEALAHVPDDDGRIAQAELYRLKGELLLLANADGDDGSRSRQGVGKRADASRAAAEACFSQAIEVAQRQQAKMWELRAATSLGRLWLAHGKKAEARRLLADTCDWFTEGSDIADLRDAKALLA
jgi:predicted ATPase